MKKKLYFWWQKWNKRLLITGYIVVSVLIFMLLVAIIGGYLWGWQWIGVTSNVGPALKPGQQYRPEKTLWDWLQLLIAPGVLLSLGVWFTRGQQLRDQRLAEQSTYAEREIAMDNQRETVLQEHVNKMAELLLDKQLRNSLKDDEAQKVSRVRVLTVLPRLDSSRKRSVLQFLYESDLIDRNKPIVDLLGADLSGADLSDANFSNAKLSGANFRRANLRDANLRRTDFSGANLMIANLRRADLSDANLSNAKLINADLYRVDLSGANLSGASLNRANLSNANLRRANLSDTYLNGANLMGAKLSDADLSRADLSGAKLSGADLSGAKLNDASLNDANLSQADLWNAKLNDANLRRADLSRAALNGADLSAASLNDANLNDANFNKALIKREQWEQARSRTDTSLPDTSSNT